MAVSRDKLFKEALELEQQDRAALRAWRISRSLPPFRPRRGRGCIRVVCGTNLAAADLFVDDIDTAVARVHEAPHRGPRIQRDIRRYLFRKFPFSLIYRVTSGTVEVIAVAHHRRRPEYWKRR